MREHNTLPSYDAGNHDAAPHAPNVAIDIWWPVFVIGFGLAFVAIICSWNPTW